MSFIYQYECILRVYINAKNVFILEREWLRIWSDGSYAMFPGLEFAEWNLALILMSIAKYFAIAIDILTNNNLRNPVVFGYRQK